VKTIQDRVTIENRLATLEVKIEEIMENHLPSIEKKVDWVTGLLITNLISLILLLLSKYL
jgi:tetrahydromethanopterin S-methyltransferase subunit G